VERKPVDCRGEKKGKGKEGKKEGPIINKIIKRGRGKGGDEKRGRRQAEKGSLNTAKEKGEEGNIDKRKTSYKFLKKKTRPQKRCLLPKKQSPCRTHFFSSVEIRG